MAAGRILIFASWLIAASLALPAQAQERLAVIVNAEREDTLTTEEVARIYLKQRRFWSERESIVPINREADSDIRKAFTERVFADEARRLNTYWNRQYYKGVMPPLTLASDEAVRRFVALEPNAIGYISESWLDASVRAVLFLPPPNPPSP
jgi:ABC-type phosphate transport system substrate-binding protein